MFSPEMFLSQFFFQKSLTSTCPKSCPPTICGRRIPAATINNVFSIIIKHTEQKITKNKQTNKQTNEEEEETKKKKKKKQIIKYEHQKLY
jgi:Na+/citrate or Na+/malate symporter